MKKVRSSQHWEDWDRRSLGQLPRQPRLTSKLQVWWKNLSQKKKKVTIKQDTWHQTLASPLVRAHTHIYICTHTFSYRRKEQENVTHTPVHAHTFSHRKREQGKCYLTTDSQRKHGRVNRSREQSNLTPSRETPEIISHHHKRRRRVSSASSEGALLLHLASRHWVSRTERQ